MSTTRYKIERRKDGVLVVRVQSEVRNGEQLPDAVFSFRCGDPQYSEWEEKWRAQKNGSHDSDSD